MYQDGAASLHTRSLKYGKLRNGVFLSVSGTGGGAGGVVRSRRQVWTVQTANRGGEVDVVLGVNGYIWICKHVGGELVEGKGGRDVGVGMGVNNLEEKVGEGMYENRNESIGEETRREIARLSGCVRALVEGGCRVDEEMVMRAYEASLEDEGVGDEEEGESGEYLGGERGRRVVRESLRAMHAARR